MAEQDQHDTDRTEDPTQKRLDEALERGDVVKSQEVSTWFVIAGGALVLAAFAGSMGSGLTTTFRGLFANAHQIPLDGPGLVAIVLRIEREVLASVAIPLVVLVLAAIVGNMIQHRLVWSAQPLKPQFSKISPLAGLKRLFSSQALANFAKGLVKLVLIGGVMFALLWPQRDRLEALVNTDLLGALSITRSLALSMLGAVVAIMFFVAAADYLFQYRQWFERQKMSVRELKEEFKQTEGDPMIKGKIRQLRQSRMRKRIIAAVPKASVVITNPTHYSIALQYERGMNAPVCVAKGVDGLALRIREVASEHSIPIVENPPLARALHAVVEIDQEIPPEHYKAVAEVIGYVMRLRRAAPSRNTAPARSV
jgi:flagellar biosynthesis protein FlhB